MDLDAAEPVKEIAVADMRIGAEAGWWRLPLWGGVGLLLLLPLLAMSFTREVAWTGGDFAAAAVLLGGGALLFEIAIRRFRRPRQRLVAGVAILAGVLLVWAEAAVGILR